MKNLIWLRNDLRLEDNPIITHACQQGPSEALFIVCQAQWRQHDESAAKIGLKLDALLALANDLNALNIPLHIIECDFFHQCDNVLTRFCQQHQFTDIWLHREIPLHEQQRDQKVLESLTDLGIRTHVYGWDLFLPMPIYNQQGLPFRVFTPFYKKWLQQLQGQDNRVIPAPQKQPHNDANRYSVALTEQTSDIVNKITSLKKEYRQDLWALSYTELDQKIIQFCHAKMAAYPSQRDIPAVAGTSTLSPYLALGMIGPRYLLNLIQLECADQGQDWRENDWLRELAWRDFYKQLMWHFPALSRHQAFKDNTEQIKWNEDEEVFQAWCDGKTGFPIVDAAMRQLKQTGWMHNRLRMISASFLTKLLFIDWRKGERFFMQNLIDGDFAANNGGWQWSASTGCDAVPYFRVFNPLRQSEKFDPEGQFIRRFLPELAILDNKSIHNPTEEQRQLTNYPRTIVDYKQARTHAISAFEKITKQNEGL
ncbi:deoxyribodipyrimidine photo-lyase [Marinomonas agarivorans]|nr:deoxyribodipyrimidine photo-lyase [Marinomonas agarivorans]